MGLKLVDISNPGRPGVIHTLDTGAYARHLVVADGLVAVAQESGGLLLARVTGRELRLLSTIPLDGSARGVALGPEGRCYVATGPGGLAVVDVSEPAAPRVVFTVPALSYARGVALSGGRVYLAESEAGVRVFDVSDPSAAPVPLGAITTERAANRIAVKGDVVMVAEDSAGVRLLDVSDPKNPRSFGGQRF